MAHVGNYTIVPWIRHGIGFLPIHFNAILFEKHPCTWMIPIYKRLIYIYTKNQKMPRNKSCGPIPGKITSPARPNQARTMDLASAFLQYVQRCPHVMQSIQVVGVVVGGFRLVFFWLETTTTERGFRNIHSGMSPVKLM